MKNLLRKKLFIYYTLLILSTIVLEINTFNTIKIEQEHLVFPPEPNEIIDSFKEDKFILIGKRAVGGLQNCEQKIQFSSIVYPINFDYKEGISIYEDKVGHTQLKFFTRENVKGPKSGVFIPRNLIADLFSKRNQPRFTTWKTFIKKGYCFQILTEVREPLPSELL